MTALDATTEFHATKGHSCKRGYNAVFECTRKSFAYPKNSVVDTAHARLLAMFCALGALFQRTQFFINCMRTRRVFALLRGGFMMKCWLQPRQAQLQNGSFQDCACGRRGEDDVATSSRLQSPRQDDIELIWEVHVRNVLEDPGRWEMVTPLVATCERFFAKVRCAKVSTRDITCRGDTSGRVRSTAPVAFSYLSIYKMLL